MKKVAFHTLGCKLNFSETSSLARSFTGRGYQKVPFGEKADVVVINTCSVTDNADKKCRKVVREARQAAPDAFVAVVGCYAQLKPQEIAAIEGVDAVLGANEKFRLHELLGDFERSAQARVFACDIEQANTFFPAYSAADRTRSFLKVQDGCDYSCTFCTIPLARGSSRSATIAEVVQQARKLGEEGVREVVLTGVNTGDFGIRNGTRQDRFIDLLKVLAEVQEVPRFRISSIEPNLLTREIIELVADAERFMPHFHIPLQSGSDKLLKAMKRRYLKALYSERIAAIKEAMPQAAIGVDVIVGFPGETEDDFLQTYRYLNELPISYLHVFTYSERPNTPAADMSGQVPQEVRHMRSAMLRNLSEKKKRAFYQSQAGLTHRVLVEQDIEGGLIYGFTENYIRTGLPRDNYQANQIVEVVIDSIDTNGLARGIPANTLIA